ncbi:MAG: DUF2155 domain-containing protein [Parvibaculales bacterium]
MQESSAQIAVFKSLDKVTGKTALLEIPVKSVTTLGPLTITVQACFSTPPEEPPETKAYLEVDETREGRTEQLFSGWMFASSPGLNGLEHPVYDLWSMSCKTASGEVFTGRE